MKSFKNIAAQGDFIIRRIDKLPEDVREIEPTDGVFIVAHSETGHHHVIEAEGVRAYVPEKPDLYRMFLGIDKPTAIKHLRSFDTHEALGLEGGVFEIKRQREYTPQGFRRAQD